jgi:hypothetical protein
MAWIDPYPNPHRRKKRRGRRLSGGQRSALQRYRAKGRARDARGRFRAK